MYTLKIETTPVELSCDVYMLNPSGFVEVHDRIDGLQDGGDEEDCSSHEASFG
jgi:hypothetical protein